MRPVCRCVVKLLGGRTDSDGIGSAQAGPQRFPERPSALRQHPWRKMLLFDPECDTNGITAQVTCSRGLSCDSLCLTALAVGRIAHHQCVRAAFSAGRQGTWRSGFRCSRFLVRSHIAAAEAKRRKARLAIGVDESQKCTTRATVPPRTALHFEP